MARSGRHAQGKVLSTPWAVFVIVGAIAAVLVIQYVYATRVIDAYNSMPPRGQFGDIFGGVNAFFTGLAFAGILVTIFLQRRELEWQREELRESTDLNALTALANAYGTRLSPYWARRTTLNQELERCNNDLEFAREELRGKTLSSEIDPISIRKRELRARRETLWEQLKQLEGDWGEWRNMHDTLITKLAQKSVEAQRIP
jgi:hypothetical protein